ncbi:WYL domain-containing protein [Viridibacillus sp. NPDC096237]|uniref:WYL domain-containing protein n=1 Tax=Viridibacillus sp. NPDC096237 TaxID=3390721 RepID=UPI003CFDFF33
MSKAIRLNELRLYINRVKKFKVKIDFKIDNQSKESPLLKELIMAAIGNKPLRISYLGVKRDIQPIGLFSQYGRWYCPSYCYLRKEFRLFRCDRISEVGLSTRKDKMNLNETNLNDIINLLSSKKEYELIVELTPEGVEKYKSNVWSYYQISINSKGHGVIKGSISAAEIDFLADYFIQMGKHAKVVQPIELRAEIKKKILVLNVLYQ